MRSRVGSLKLGENTYRLRLHPHRATPYRPSYELVWPTYDFVVPGSEAKVVGDPNLRLWHIDSWSGGEGEDLWDPQSDAYDYSTNCRPATVGEGLILGADQLLTTAAAGGTFAEGSVFGLAQGKLWAALDGTVHPWDSGNTHWDAGWNTGGGGVVTSIADGDDATNLFVGMTDNIIYKVPAGGGAAHYTSFTADPVVMAFDGVLYALDGDDLYSVSKTAVNTRTQLADLAGSSATYLALGAPSWNRLASSDVGPIWLQVLDNGQTFIWQYNVALDTDSRVGKLPVDFATPYSIFWAHGFIFVGFRYAAAHTLAGDAYLYYQRGSQRGVAGPLRSPSATASTPVLIGGMIGDDLIVYFDGAVWAYNLSSGGIYQMSESTSSSHTSPRQCVTYGKEVFLSYVNSTSNVEKFDTQAYTTETAGWYSGRFDFGYQGIDKILLDVTVVTEPLPASTQLTCKVAVEGGAATALSGTFDTDSDTSYTWTASTADTSLVGRDFEIHLVPATTVTTSTPTVRSVTARAIGAERQRSWTLELDTGTWQGGSEGSAPRSADLLADLKAVGEYNGLGTFTDPWDGEEHDPPTDYTVLVVSLQHTEADGEPIAVLQMREAAYV